MVLMRREDFTRPQNRQCHIHIPPPRPIAHRPLPLSHSLLPSSSRHPLIRAYKTHPRRAPSPPKRQLMCKQLSETEHQSVYKW